MSDITFNNAGINNCKNQLLLDNFSACRNYLGMRNGNIPDINIQASSESSSYPAHMGRLNGASFWYPQSWDNERWIQADIGYQTYVSGVATQGAGRWDNWVASFKVSTFYMTTADDETFVSEDRGIARVSKDVFIILKNPLVLENGLTFINEHQS